MVLSTFAIYQAQERTTCMVHIMYTSKHVLEGDWSVCMSCDLQCLFFHGIEVVAPLAACRRVPEGPRLRHQTAPGWKGEKNKMEQSQCPFL